MTKFKLFFFSLFGLILGISAVSCKTADAGLEKVANAANKSLEDRPLDNNLLWKISGEGLEEPSYLFGTIHMINGDDFFLPDGTMSAIDDSKQMVFEIDLNEISDMSNIMGLMSKAFMKDNLTIKDLLTAEEYDIVDKHFQKMGLPMMMFQRLKPMFLTVFASGDMSPGDLQSGKIKSYEMEFMEMAKNSNKTVKGLETIEFQISVFDSIPYSEQAKMLMETILAGDSDSDSFKKIVEVYKQQDIEKMLAMTMSEEAGLSDYDDILLNQRNKNWIPLMEEMMKVQQNFFAVGAGHLAGDEGVIKLLRKAGYKVESYTGS